MAIEVEPRAAQIWLDRQLTGTGRIELGAIHDGVLHELRFMAPGYETKTLFFRDAPPAGSVLLKRVAPSAVEDDGAAAAAEGSPGQPEEESASAEPERDSTAPDVPRRAIRRRAPPAPPPAPSPPPARAHPVAENPPSAAPPAVKKAPRVELIEVHTPRVQVLD